MWGCRLCGGGGHHGFEIVEVDMAGTFTVDSTDHASAVLQGGAMVAEVDEDAVELVRADAPVLVQIKHVEGGRELINHVKLAACMTTSCIEVDKLVQIYEAIAVCVHLGHHQQSLLVGGLVSQRPQHAAQLLGRDFPIPIRIELSKRMPHLF